MNSAKFVPYLGESDTKTAEVSQFGVFLSVQFKPYSKTQCYKEYTEPAEMARDIERWVQLGELPCS